MSTKAIIGMVTAALTVTLGLIIHGWMKKKGWVA